ncbi:MAG: aromatic ring-hydroxylating dioxygenase subunit alpha [Enterobacterales bacterium]|nr:aromatic ring-hydroxylating dioxygenase subunit alpha [Enterobacterales bacterium]
MHNLNLHLKQQPLDHAYALDAAFYRDNAILALENQHIFNSQWQLVGHTSQIQNIGDQLTIQIGDLPVIIVRKQKDELVALHNVCRHRAGPLSVETSRVESEKPPVLRCQYHGWSYDLDGQLKTAPEMQSTKDFNPFEHHLPKANLEIWQNLIFVCIQKPQKTLNEMLKGIAPQIKPINLKTMQFHHRDEYLINCNWKVYMDNYLEGYHLPHVHPGLSRLLDYRQYTTKLYDDYSYQFSPLDNQQNNNAGIYYGEGSAHYYTIFPNLMLNILPGRLQTNVILPAGANQTRIIFDYYYSDLHSDNTQKLIEQDQNFSDEVQQEDIEICEKVQLGLNSGSYIAGPLCEKREQGLVHFQNLIRKYLAPVLTYKS